MDLGIAGRRAIVAGASEGLGFATAVALAEEGVHVVICGRDPARIAEAARSIGALATPLVADLSTVDGAHRFAAAGIEACGDQVDILIANSGGPEMGLASRVDFAVLRQTLDANLLSLMALCDAVLPGMCERGWGRIVAITTVGVREPLPGMVYSNVARAGFTGYLKQLSQEVIGQGVTVNSLLPNSHATGRLERMIGARLDDYAATLKSGRLGSAEDFGRIAAFLCSEHANYLTGVALPVDGGSGTRLA